MLIAVPVSEETALSAELAETAIGQATKGVDDAGITGAAVTPFVLSGIVELTDGRALAANKALLVSNAEVAGKIAVAARRY